MGGTLGFLLHEVYLENGQYLKGKLMFWCIFAKLELEFASFISKKLGETLDILLHESYLENADYWKGKWTFACRFWGSGVTWHSFAWSIPGKCTSNLLERKMHIIRNKLTFACSYFCRNWSSQNLQGFISKKLGGTLDILLHEVYLENADYWKGKWTFACRFLQKLSNWEEHLASCCMKYTWKMDIIWKGN